MMCKMINYMTYDIEQYERYVWFDIRYVIIICIW